MPYQQTLLDIKQMLGPEGWIESAKRMLPYFTDWKTVYSNHALAVVKPANTSEVSEVVRMASQAGIAIIPQGGNTGLMGGTLPSETQPCLILNLSRMNKIRHIDPVNFTITAEAGCILKDIQDHAADIDRLFPLTIGTENTCQIGGNISTNAGGKMSIRYGNTRDLVLGIEVVLPDGRTWDGLQRLRKNNGGYDLKHLFVGAEGTLGIITAVVLKLFPQPVSVETAFIALPNFKMALKFLTDLRVASGNTVTAFEIMSRQTFDLVLTHISGTKNPFKKTHDWYILVELSTGSFHVNLRQIFEERLSKAHKSDEILDAILMREECQCQEIWRIRHSVTAAEKAEGGSIKHDISVPVSNISDFIDQALDLVKSRVPGIRLSVFGHLGDGNLNFNFVRPKEMKDTEFMKHQSDINNLVHNVVLSFDGSTSAELGIGHAKRDELTRVKSPVELALMHAVKKAFDPQNIMNPSKVLKMEEAV